jgi:tetratricopeptide (TPR) repeat protein
VFKKIFGKREDDREYSVDDLIVLERYDEAEARLRETMKQRQDLHLRLKLAEVHVGQRRVADAIEQYIYVAEKFAVDGFHDRAIALLGKARRINPLDDTLEQRINRYEQARRLEHSRDLAMEGFLLGQEAREGRGTAVLEFQGVWRKLQKSRLLRELAAEQLRLLFQGIEVRHLFRDQVLVERGAQQQALYVIAGGELLAQVDGPEGDSLAVRTFGSGQIIGEAALFERHPWPARYQATTKTTLIELTADGLQVCLTGNPDPRGFLEVLRRDHADREVAQAVARLEP